MSKRILVLGNSITKHSPRGAIGWYADWGMAASAEDRDFVHHLKRLAAERDPENVVIGINIAVCEREYWDAEKCAAFPPVLSGLDFEPDIIVMRIGENVPGDALAKHSYKDGFASIIDIFSPADKKVIVATCFWPNKEKDDAMRAAAAERGYPIVELGDLGLDKANMATDRFGDNGVGRHPGDLGMERIAARIWAVLCDML
ncbi:MAG: SGNH/GDSL hydrolase family protein [Clostridiales bacterium]|nr:SGNH/GDSL hydrolase family protein [Clostridiales bacterium]